MRKVNSIIMIFVVGLNLVSPTIITAKQTENENIKSREYVRTLAPTDIVPIPDDELKFCINTRIGQNVDEDITVTQMEGITKLSCSAIGIEITNLSGLEYAINLREFSALGENGGTYKNSISDISPLKNLTSLTKLNLDGNPISDISPLKNLTNLKDLNLSFGQISDISSLSGLVNLQTLRLNYNQISDISVLSNLSSLINLSLENNQISDISSLSGLVDIQSLNINNNQISDINVVSKMRNLYSLGANDNQIKDLTPLKDLTPMKKLEVEENQISDISPLTGLSSLNSLYLDGNEVEDLTPLKELPMRNLYLENNHISDFSPLSKYGHSIVISVKNQTPIIDLGTFENKDDIPKSYKALIKEGDRTTTEHEVEVDLSNVVEGENTYTKSYDFASKGLYWLNYNGVVTVKLTYSPASSNEKPVIDGINDVTLNINDAFDPMAGVTATDKEDGDLTSKLTITDNNLDTTKVGNYKITYSVTDSDGNKTDGSRNIKVVDNSPNEKPVIDGINDVTLNVNDAFDPMAGVTATDKEDGDLTSKINVFTKNHREDKLTEGEYIYYYSVTDSAGAESKVERKVTVTSGATNEKPVIDGINDVTLNINDAFDPMQGVTATDKEDGDLTSKLTITDNNLDTTKVGNYKITYSVTDSDGNKTDGSRNINVVDNSTTKPNKPGDGGDITPMKPGTDDKDNTLSKTGSNMLVISLSAIAALLLIKKSYKL